jgi:Tol biopolymer transport system component
MLPLAGFLQQQPLWSPDGASLIFFGDVDGEYGVYRIASDGSAPPERILLDRGRDVTPFDWSRSGVLVFREEGDLWTLPPDGTSQRYFASAVNESDASFSPDGRWITYVAGRADGGPREVFVRPYPGPDPAVQISSGFGINPAWSRDGRTLYYRGRDPSGRGLLMAVDLDFSQGLRPGRPRVYIPEWELIRTPLRGYDVAPDGSLLRYVTPPDAEQERFGEFQVVLGFGAELKRRIPN